MSEEQVYEKLHRIYQALRKIGYGIDYLNEVVKFIDNRGEYFTRFWEIYEVLGKWIINVKIPTWTSDGLSYFSMRIVELNPDEQFTIVEVGKKVKEREQEIISKLLDGLSDFLNNVLLESDC